MSGLAPLAPADYLDIVRRALAEDVGTGDVTTRSTVPASVHGHGILLAKSPLVVAGLDVARAVFTEVGGDAVRFTPRAHDGEPVAAGHGHRRSRRTGARPADSRADSAQPAAADVRHRHCHPSVRRRRGRADHHPGHAQDDAHAAGAGEFTPCVPAVARTTGSASTTRC